MASRLFREMAAKVKETKGLGSVLVGSNYLTEGTHDVVIQSVDSTKADEGYIFVEYAADGKTQRDLISLFNREKTEMSYGVKSLISATIPEEEALEKFFELIDKDDHAFEVLTGMKLQVELAYGKGFRINSTSSGKYIAVDTETKTEITEEVDSVDEAKLQAGAAGHKQAYIRVSGRKATNVEDNVKALYTALEAKKSLTKNATFSVGAI